MPRIVLSLVCLLALTGCSSTPEPLPPPSATASATSTAPSDGVLLTDLGFEHSPPGFSIPRGSRIQQSVDSANNVTVILTAPPGEEVAEYLRRTLPSLGFTITADAQDSLLFESAVHDGAFTVTGDLSALSLRTDRET